VKGEADLVLSGAWAGSHKGIRAQVTLDVGGDDFSGDAITLNEPLVCPRHDESRGVKKTEDEEKQAGSDVRGRKAKKNELRETRRGSRLQDNAGPRAKRVSSAGEYKSCGIRGLVSFSGGRGEEVFQKQKQERAGAEANTQMRGVTNIPALGRWPVKAVMGGCGVLFRDAVGTGERA
jgi:hypothetical protein